MSEYLRGLLSESLTVLRRWTTDGVGNCAACYESAAVRGGRNPSVLDGEPHRDDCPIGEFEKRAREALRGGA